MSKRVERLKDAIEVMHKCKAMFLQNVPIVALMGSKVVWDVVVTVFAIIGHPKAQRCYAWGYRDETDDQFVTVLELPPVKDARTAVQASIVAQSKQTGANGRDKP